MSKKVPRGFIKLAHVVHNIHVTIEITMPRINGTPISLKFRHNIDCVLKSLRDGPINVASRSGESFKTVIVQQTLACDKTEFTLSY